jgi:putative endonuclease
MGRRARLDERPETPYHDPMSSSKHFVYILTNHSNTVLYTGQTHDLLRRMDEHREGMADGFTKRYRVTKLVYYDVADDRNGALYREKQIKGFTIMKKMALIETTNPSWEDLSDRLA